MKVRAEIDFDLLNHLCIDDFDGNKYLIGCGFIHNDSHIFLDNGDQFPIKKDTRSVHFGDLVDKNDNPIFASLVDGYKGGDIIQYDDVEGTVYFDCFSFQVRANTNQGYLSAHNFSKSHVIGVQE